MGSVNKKAVAKVIKPKKFVKWPAAQARAPRPSEVARKAARSAMKEMKQDIGNQAFTGNDQNSAGNTEAVRQTLLQAAQATIDGPRQNDYGDKLQNFSQIAMLFQGTLAPKLLPGAEITPEDVAMLMMQVKIARLAKLPDHKDSILDVAGYAGCYDKLQEERDQGYVLKGATRDSRNTR